MRRSEKFGLVGKKVAALAKNQTEIAEALGLTAQSVSSRISVHDLRDGSCVIRTDALGHDEIEVRHIKVFGELR